MRAHVGSGYAEDLLDVVNYVLTAVFAIEMVLKHIAYGARVYWRDYVNVFDGTIVVVSLAEIAIHLLGIMEESRGLTAMRALRLLRVFKVGVGGGCTARRASLRQPHT